MNESMLTGESTAVIKNSLDNTNDIYNPDDFESAKKNTLYNGTKIIQATGVRGQKALGLVIRTGFLTTKGSLVRTILYPQETKLRFYQDSMIFIAGLFVLCFISYLYILPDLMEDDNSTIYIINRLMNLITVAVPPALPAVMSQGMAFAIL